MHQIEKVEEAMLAVAEQIDCPVTHHFSDGVYCREIFMPAGAIVLGHEHTTTHLNIISKGSCILKDIDTGDETTITAPCTFESKGGVRKLLKIVADCVWTTVHVTEETDLDVIESQVIKKSNTYKLGGVKWLGQQQ